jgi:hypothetical protein
MIIIFAFIIAFLLTNMIAMCIFYLTAGNNLFTSF